MELTIDVVDAFTDTLFKGNSAAVVITDDWLPDSLMQNIAAENNLSETAYLVPHPLADYQIRWFSPLSEIAFCGHATLGAAFVLFERQPELSTLTLQAEAVGTMTITRQPDRFIQMDFPNRQPEPVSDVPPELYAGLSIKPAKVLRNQQAYFAVYDNEQQVHEVMQDKEALMRLAPHDVVVTAASQDYDFVSRYFWPANGGDEDPVTGSIHTGLAPYWAQQLNKQQLLACQVSARTGVLSCLVEDDRVFLSGQAVHYLRGKITV
jgi:PhzF family phenazine biosynthesis protein